MPSAREIPTAHSIQHCLNGQCVGSQGAVHRAVLSAAIGTLPKTCYIQLRDFGAFLAAISTSAARSWSRFALPSVTDLIFIVVLISLSTGAVATRLLNDAGTGWHIRNGELILATHSITRTDPFSSTMQGKPWYAWEWLYDVVIAAVHARAGLNGVVFVSALLIALTFALTFRLALARGGNFLVTLFFLLFSMGAAAVHFLARPHLLSWLLAIVWFHILDSSQSSSVGGRRLFWLPALMLVWVNVHGGFLAGFILLACYFIGAGIHYWRFRNPGDRDITRKRLRRLGFVSLLTALASLVNPFGYGLHIHIYRYLSNRFLISHIDEFRSPDFHGVAQQCFVVLLLVTFVGVIITRIKPSASEVLVILFAIASGLYATRNLPVSAILLTLAAAPLFGDRFAEPSTEGPSQANRSYLSALSARMGATERRMGVHAWAVLVLVVGTAVAFHGGKLGDQQLMSATFSDKRFPVQAVDAIAQRHIPGPIFAPDYWGGYLIYRLSPGVKVVVDDRHDLYGEEFFKDYLKLVNVQPGWQEVLKKNNVNWVLIPPESPLAGVLGVQQRWTVDYQDDVAVVLRNHSPDLSFDPYSHPQ